MICAVIEKISPWLKAYSFSNSLVCTASLLSWSCFLMNSSFSFFISLPDLCPSLPLLPVLQSPWRYIITCWIRAILAYPLPNLPFFPPAVSRYSFPHLGQIVFGFEPLRPCCYLSPTHDYDQGLWSGNRPENVLQGRRFRWVEVLSIHWEDYRRYWLNIRN